MTQSSGLPVIPESAPFSPEQRAYLNGLFAGWFSRGPAPAGSAGSQTPAAASAPVQALTVLFGSQTGTAEKLAKRIARDAGQRGFAPAVHDLAAYPIDRLASEQNVVVVTSTYGDGEPPDNARAFWEFLSGPKAPALGRTRFAVCALGDSNYPRFCAFGRQVDERLAELGAQRAHTRVECDVEYEAPFAGWLGPALASLAGSRSGAAGGAVELAGSESNGPETAAFRAGQHRDHPWPAPLVGNHRLNADGSAKDTRYLEFSLAGAGLEYAAGDALGIYPENDPGLVEAVLQRLGCPADAPVPIPGGAGQVPIRDGLMRHYDIARIQPALLQAMAERTGAEQLRELAAPNVNGKLTEFLRGRDVLDLLSAYPSVHFEPAPFVALLKKQQPRLYSIASSPKAHPDQVHLCVGVVRYESLGRAREGVCSGFLASRVAPGQTVRVFHHTNPNFRLPANADTAMIMVGPGTGIAPFRGFLHERRALGAKGKNWLFFGDQRSASDFLFRAELEAFQRDGMLARLDTAFSRDQAAKVYVQDRMREQARELFGWLEAGANFYVCGDASRMARDVDVALHDVIRTGGGRTEEQAAEYVRALKAAKRYQRDVY